MDWAATPLGSPAGWPQSLQTAVSILLSSRFSMWMAWGPELTFFCNAAYRRDTLGRKYPWALGRPASEVWAEIWEDIGPRVHRVLSLGQTTWDAALLLFVERSGYLEESYHTFSYSPLRDEAGQVVGMLCVVSEDTERVIGERRMTTLRDLGSDPSVTRTEEQMLAFAARQLGHNLRDLPFNYLVKPFAAADLMARVRANIELARLRNHHARWRTALVDSLQEAFFVCDEHGAVIEINSAFTDAGRAQPATRPGRHRRRRTAGRGRGTVPTVAGASHPGPSPSPPTGSPRPRHPASRTCGASGSPRSGPTCHPAGAR